MGIWAIWPVGHVSFHPNAYTLALGFATALTAIVATVAWRNRDRPGSKPFLVLLLGVGLWALGNAFQLAAAEVSTKLAFRTVAYIGHNLVPIAVLTFAASYTGRLDWFERKHITLLAVEPMLVALVMTPTNVLGLHDLVWTDVWLVPFGSIEVLGRAFGPVYWFNTAYNYVLVMGAVVLFAQLTIESSDIGRKQGTALLIAVFPPFLANILWIAGVTPIDLTPFAFVITGLAFAYALYRFRLFDVVPVGHESILDAFRDGYVVVDDAGRVIDLNESVRERMVQHPAPLNRPFEEVLPRVAAELESSTDPDAFDDELELDGPEGTRFVEVSVSPLAERPGRVVILRDVTEKREIERRYRRLIENSSDLISVLDEGGTFQYLSPSADRILGQSPGELVGEDAFSYIHPEDREAVREQFEKAVADPSYTAAAEYRYRHADGSWIWLSSRGTNRFDDPYVEGFVVNSREVTQRRRRERALEQQNQRLDEFTGAVSHDLRNPLNVIRGRLDLARETGDPEHLEAMEQAAERMETLIEDLLQLARQGRLVGETESVPLETAARNAWANVDTAEASLSCESDLGSVAADPDRLYQLFENLFRNAVEHAGETATITVGPMDRGFYVADDGPGIPEEDREAVFERGFTTSEDGTGFGLSIVESIVSAHGWYIEVVESERGGARFEITGVEAERQPIEGT